MTKFPDGERFCLHDSSVLVEELDIARLGTAVGNYRLDKILGRGGMGTVYSGEHVYIKKAVAVKILHPQFARYPEAVNRFLREARAATTINHANVVDVTDFGLLPDGLVYFVMEFLDGKSLEDLIEREGAVELHRALNIANQISYALEAAHHNGVIHRDLKPDNIMLLTRPGRRDLIKLSADQSWTTEREATFDFVKVLDFGIAKVMTPDDLVADTVQGAVFGTPEYMSPEAARGEEVDHRADVYSLGVIMFDMLCGRPPFEAPQSADVLAMHINKPPPSPREFAPHREITEAAELVVLRAMQKDPNKRYQTMADLRRDILGAYGSVNYRRHYPGAPLPTSGVGPPPIAQAGSDNLERWMQADASAAANGKRPSASTLSSAEAERIADALEIALDDDDE